MGKVNADVSINYTTIFFPNKFITLPKQNIQILNLSICIHEFNLTQLDTI